MILKDVLHSQALVPYGFTIHPIFITNHINSKKHHGFLAQDHLCSTSLMYNAIVQKYNIPNCSILQYITCLQKYNIPGNYLSDHGIKNMWSK